MELSFFYFGHLIIQLTLKAVKGGPLRAVKRRVEIFELLRKYYPTLTAVHAV